MTPEAQRIAIAEACGWTDIHVTGPGFSKTTGLVGGRPGDNRGAAVPDYLGSLDAIAEAEYALLTSEKLETAYAEHLTFRWLNDPKTEGQHPYSRYRTTAAQRAEALLRTIGRWGGA